MSQRVAKWASASLERTLGHPVGPLQCRPLKGDASDRRYFRVGDERVSWLVMVASGRGGEFLSVPDPPREEMDFVSIGAFLRQGGVTVPTVHFKAPTRDWLLIEDFGDLTLGKALAAADETESRALYAKAMAMLVRLAALTPSAREKNIPAVRRRMDVDTLVWEMNHFVNWWMDREGVSPRRADRSRMADEFFRMAHLLVESGDVLVHRDFHSRNLMVRDGEIAVLDFQDAVLGSITYDLTSLLLDSYQPLDLVMAYAAADDCRLMLRDAGLNAGSQEEFRRLFAIQGLQRCLKVAGRLNFLEKAWGKSGYRAAAMRASATACHLMATHEDLAPLRRLMLPYLPELNAPPPRTGLAQFPALV